jgi:hypothetical protein
MAALAICAVTAADWWKPVLPRRRRPGVGQQPPDDPGLIPFTVLEVKRPYMLFTRKYSEVL